MDESRFDYLSKHVKSFHIGFLIMEQKVKDVLNLITTVC